MLEEESIECIVGICLKWFISVTPVERAVY